MHCEFFGTMPTKETEAEPNRFAFPEQESHQYDAAPQ
jgi:hypothetical protein